MYAGDEKKQVHSILKKNSNVIDVEIEFTTLLERDEEEKADKEAEKNRIDRIDIVALEEGPGGSISIVFYEVKTFNDPRIRAKENAEVLGTLEDYRQTINQAEPDIIKAYRQVCHDLVELQRLDGKRGRKLDPLVQKATNNDVTLDVDPNPRLVIVGYDDAQWRDKRWRDQLEKLGSDFRVRGWGNAANVRLQPQAWRMPIRAKV